jgi:hypothetical protein
MGTSPDAGLLTLQTRTTSNRRTACIGILRLAKGHGNQRLEAACERALEIGARSYGAVASILRNNLDRRRPHGAAEGPAINHTNIRGPGPTLKVAVLDQYRWPLSLGMGGRFHRNAHSIKAENGRNPQKRLLDHRVHG